MNTNRPGLLHRENRQALFGTNSGRSSPLPTHYAANRTAEDLEGQNDDYLKGLRSKVKLLKDITINIGNEVRDSTKLMQGMNDNFDETGGFLGGTMKKMNRMAKRQGGQFCLWIAFLLICFTVFFWTWLWRR